MSIAAIQTEYAGCRFRSRLEARWAVFFDTLGIEWQYEPQGFEVGPNNTKYLPDFYLPGLAVWAEVKGELTATELRTLIWCASAAGLPLTPTGQRPVDVFPWRDRLLILGDIPMPGSAWLHTVLQARAGELVVAVGAALWPSKSGGWGLLQVMGAAPMNQYVAGADPEPGDLKVFCHGFEFRPLTQSARIADAYRAARSARFEHGESGAPIHPAA